MVNSKSQTIKYKTGTHRSQTKLNLSEVVLTTNNQESTQVCPIIPQETTFLKEQPILLEKDDFIANLIESGENPQKALEMWLLVEKRRKA